VDTSGETFLPEAKGKKKSVASKALRHLNLADGGEGDAGKKTRQDQSETRILGQLISFSAPKMQEQPFLSFYTSYTSFSMI
jgi:hypothetical protein